MLPRRVASRLPARSGLSVIEVLVALVLLSVGLLGIAGSSALALRSLGRAERERHAVGLAGLRLARLAAAACGGARSGELPEDAAGVREWWVVRAERNGAAPVEVRVEWIEGRGTRVLALEGALLC